MANLFLLNPIIRINIAKQNLLVFSLTNSKRVSILPIPNHLDFIENPPLLIWSDQSSPIFFAIPP